MGWVCLALNHNCTSLEVMLREEEVIIMLKEPPWMIFKNSVHKHATGLDSLQTPKIICLPIKD